jgi:MoxR-like ATPase
MNDTLFSNLQNFRASLNTSFLEREDVIDGLLASVITKQNSFLFGLPGTGKSELVRAVANGFSGTQFFGYLLSPTTDPIELFGPVAVSKLLKDEYVRDVTGYLPSANIAFLDELFRGSSAVLNSLLTILNERTFNNGRDVIETPIQSIVAATNSFPQEESLQAFCDRFLFRPTVDLLKKPTSKRSLDAWALGIKPRPAVESQLTFKDLQAIQEEVTSVQASDDFLDSFSQVIDLLATRGITISDRRRVQILKFLRGWALVQGDEELYPEHLHRSLVHIVYQSQDDVQVIKEVLEQAVPTAEKLLESIKRAHSGILTEYHAIHAQESKSVDDLNRLVGKLRKMHRDLDTLSNKLDNILESGQYRISAHARQTATKLAQTIESSSQSVASSISNISS